MATPSCVASSNPTFCSGEILPGRKALTVVVVWSGRGLWGGRQYGNAYFPSGPCWNDAPSSGGFIPRGQKV